MKWKGLSVLRYFDIEYVREHLDDLVEEIAACSSFVITVNGWPKALVAPWDPDRKERRPKEVLSKPSRKLTAKS